MSTPRLHLPPRQVRERAACMCVTGNACSSFAPGHALHLIQTRLASATPTEWVDAVVASSDAELGEVVVAPLDGSPAVVLWNAGGAASHAVVGTPVALHARYDVLAIGRERFNTARV
ncbi:hypothetical protein GCM10009775_26220 [Microbacterium aoyamense]|uniref:Uncharacterized protein n=1 Tax=Microbacterium aoyamense TaxID=344166 RepID=A0ABN2PVC1_9MICO|nr:hypothetical protein [Microbacterium aoyamense]